MNYFNYFTEIEDAFVRRRGKHLLLSSMDWALIESWKEMDVPLHVVLRGIEKSFDSWEAKPRKRSVKTLLYCQEEIEAQFGEWREARVGAASEQDQNGDQPGSEGLPFSRATILAHLQRGRSGLMAALADDSMRKKAIDDDFSETLERAVARLTELEEEFAEVALFDAQKLEQSLTGVERMLSDALRLVARTEHLATLEREVKEQLKPYRKQMEPAVYQQTFDNLLLKRLREEFRIPRLSLFYL